MMSYMMLLSDATTYIFTNQGNILTAEHIRSNILIRKLVFINETLRSLREYNTVVLIE